MQTTFTRGTALHEMELMMKSVPNFAPRKTGSKISSSPTTFIKLTAENLSYNELLKETYSPIVKSRKFLNRLKELEENFDGNMFYDSRHKTRFYSGVENLSLFGRKQDHKYLPAIFLLTATGKLWTIAKNHIYVNKIDFQNMNLRGADIESYTFLQTAITIFKGIKKIEFRDLIDDEIVSHKTFKIIIHASLIQLYGIQILEN